METYQEFYPFEFCKIILFKSKSCVLAYTNRILIQYDTTQ